MIMVLDLSANTALPDISYTHLGTMHRSTCQLDMWHNSCHPLQWLYGRHYMSYNNPQLNGLIPEYPSQLRNTGTLNNRDLNTCLLGTGCIPLESQCN